MQSRLSCTGCPWRPPRESLVPAGVGRSTTLFKPRAAGRPSTAQPAPSSRPSRRVCRGPRLAPQAPLLRAASLHRGSCGGFCFRARGRPLETRNSGAGANAQSSERESSQVMRAVQGAGSRRATRPGKGQKEQGGPARSARQFGRLYEDPYDAD